MANSGYDTLTITINTDSKQANASIKKLSNNLEKLNDTAKNIDKEKIEEMKTLLVDIASIDFSNVSKGLQDIVSAFKSFQGKAFGKGLGGLSGTRQSKTPMYAGTQIPDFSAFPQGNIDGLNAKLKEMTDQFKQSEIIANSLKVGITDIGIVGKSAFESMLTPTEKLGQELQAIGLNGNQMEVVLSAIDNHLGTISPQQLEAVEKILKQAGLSAKEVEKTLKRLGNQGDQSGKKASGGMKQLALQFKNILKYRVVRKVIQSVFAEISNAITELANIDSGFDQSLGEIKSAFSYIGRVLVSVIAPIVKVIAPIITALAEGIGSVVSSLGSTLAGALGQEEFAEAQENVESYTESLNKAKSVQTGFDKLNVISQDKGSGNFEMKQTEATNNLGEILQKVIVAVKPIFTALQSFIQKIQPLLQVIIDIVGQILTETMDDVFISLASFIELIGTILQVIGELLQALSPILRLLTTIGDMGLNSINTLITTLSFLITQILQPLLPLIELIGAVLQVIAPALDFISGVLQASFGGGENKNVAGRVVAGVLTGGLSELLRLIKGQYATGGFPEEDGIFFANHNELVGQFSNGKTAVANNQQITQGIYQAVLQAMREGGGSNVVIQVDGREIARAVNKANANMGSQFLMGGNINYGK